MIVALLPTQRLVDAVGPVDGVELVVWRGDEPPPRDRADLVVPDYVHARAALTRLHEVDGLRVVQVQTAGYDGVLELMPDDVVLASARGVHDDAAAELALGLTIASLRGIDVAVREAGTWHQDTRRRSLADSRVRGSILAC